MELKSILTFRSIVKNGSFQAAAKELNFVQSTVTTQIQKLEDEIGLPLLERGRQIRLTRAGEVFYEKSSALIHNYEDIVLAMSEISGGESGEVNIGVIEPTASYRMPQVIKAFRALHPKIKINIVIHNSHMFNQMVNDGQVDLAICSTPVTSLGTHYEPLFAEQVSLLYPQDSLYARIERVRLADLQNEQLLVTNSTCPFRRKLESELHEKGGTPYTYIEIGSMNALKYYVQAGYGAAVVPNITVSPLPEGTFLKPIEDFNSGLIIGLLQKKDDSLQTTAVKKFTSFVKAELEAIQGSMHTTSSE